MELVDMTDLKSVGPKGPCGFESHSRYAMWLKQIKSNRGVVEEAMLKKMVKIHYYDGRHQKELWDDGREQRVD